MTTFDIKKDAAERIIIVAHRGSCGGNIPCNTMAAYEIAVQHGADMIEVDVSKSADGTLWILHPKMEYVHLNYLGTEFAQRLPDMHDDEIRRLRYVSADRAYTEWPLCTLDEVFDRFKGVCYINIDKFWENPREISDAIRAHGMEEQIIAKTSPKPELFDIIEEYGHGIQYLPILKKDEGVHEELMHRNIRYVGAEVVFADENSYIASREFIDKLHGDGKLVWANAILYNYKVPLAGGHSDDVSLVKDPALGWGWLADRGYDIIQTDWVLAMAKYLGESGKRYRK